MIMLKIFLPMFNEGKEKQMNKTNRYTNIDYNKRKGGKKSSFKHNKNLPAYLPEPSSLILWIETTKNIINGVQFDVFSSMI